MGAIEVNVQSSVCRMCGMAFSRLKGYFPVTYASLYKGVGYLPYCRGCVEKIFNNYLNECGDVKNAVRQTCRKLDLYWDEKAFESVDYNSSIRSVMTVYITKTNSARTPGRSYDDTLRKEGTLWDFTERDGDHAHTEGEAEAVERTEQSEQSEEAKKEKPKEPSKKLVAFWGRGYDYDFYEDLQRRYDNWTKDRGSLEQNEITLFRQICLLEAIISRDSAAGKPIDKNVNALNTLLGSMNLKPTQKKDDSDSQTDNTPFGVWIRKFENEKPIPDPDPEFKDVDGIVRYISVWFLGHLCKMLNIKNTYCRMYEEEIARLRVDRPEFDEEDDETMFHDIFSYDASEEEA